MKTIEERASEYAEARCINVESNIHKNLLMDAFGSSYLQGAKEQRTIEIEKAKRAFNEACSCLNIHPWYSAVLDKFIELMEE